MDILLEEFESDDDLLRILPSVAAQVVKDVSDYLTEKEKPTLPEVMGDLVPVNYLGINLPTLERFKESCGKTFRAADSTESL